LKNSQRLCFQALFWKSVKKGSTLKKFGVCIEAIDIHSGDESAASVRRRFSQMEFTYDTWVAVMFVLLVMVIAATFLFGLRGDE
jgi:hypothetical protein